MTEQEKRQVSSLVDAVDRLVKANEIYRQLLTDKVNSLEKKVEEKHLPITLEHEVLAAVQASIFKALSESMTGYSSPLVKYAQNVVQKYQTEIEGTFDDVVKEAIRTDDFKIRVREVLLNKIAKTMISGVDGSIDKTINLMKQDAIFRSRLTLSVNSLVDEFLQKK